MFLDDEQLIELTGRKRHTAQVLALRHMGIEHRVRADGSVAVLTQHVEKLFDGVVKGAVQIRAKEPNWSALNAKST